MTNWNDLTVKCQEAMRAAAAKPGRYGGRYVARRYDRVAETDVFMVCDDDDPDAYRADESIDILAHVIPTEVRPLGYARTYLQSDGTVCFPEH